MILVAFYFFCSGDDLRFTLAIINIFQLSQHTKQYHCDKKMRQICRNYYLSIL